MEFVAVDKIKEFFRENKKALMEYLLVAINPDRKVEVYAAGSEDDATFLIERNGSVAYVPKANSENLERVYASIIDMFFSDGEKQADESSENENETASETEDLDVFTEERYDDIISATYDYLSILLCEESCDYFDDEAVDAFACRVEEILRDEFGLFVYHPGMEEDFE